jgi:hypothetical protein
VQRGLISLPKLPETRCGQGSRSWIPSKFAVFPELSDLYFSSIESIAFGLRLQVHRIESSVFFTGRLRRITIPSSVQVIRK